mgnify:CR=1 FL=1
MDAKRARILVAARDLFAEFGFAQVTTKAASERADIAAGTLFRYAATKADLLLMVYNERFRDALVAGRSAAAGIEDPSEALLALAEVVIAHQRRHGRPDPNITISGHHCIDRFNCRRRHPEVVDDRGDATSQHLDGARHRA